MNPGDGIVLVLQEVQDAVPHDGVIGFVGHIEVVEEKRAFALFYRFAFDDDVAAIAVGDPIEWVDGDDAS